MSIHDIMRIDIMNYSALICSFESGKCGKERKKITKI